VSAAAVASGIAGAAPATTTAAAARETAAAATEQVQEPDHGAPEASPANPGPQEPAEPALPALDAGGEARASSLEARLKCPICRTQSVRESPSFLAIEMRTRIREMVAAGAGDEQILDWFAARYGEDILLEPRKRGFGLAAWILPVAALAAGAALLVRRARRRAASPPEAGLSPEDRDRVERELKLRRV
jgi:cytochrome c-type biogenesis protein CcmH